MALVTNHGVAETLAIGSLGKKYFTKQSCQQHFVALAVGEGQKLHTSCF